MASRSLRIGLIPGDGIGREVIPVYIPFAATMASILTDKGRPTSTGSHCNNLQTRPFLPRPTSRLRNLPANGQRSPRQNGGIPEERMQRRPFRSRQLPNHQSRRLLLAHRRLTEKDGSLRQRTAGQDYGFV